MDLLITGGNGFIGRHLVKHLAASDHNILAPVRTKSPGRIAGVSWIEDTNYSDLSGLSAAMKRFKVIIHLAAHAHQTRDTSAADKRFFQEVNVTLTKRLFEQASEHKIEQFVFISSIGAIRSASDEVVSEGMEANPTNDYARSKYDAEQALQTLAGRSTTKLTILRPCLVYGPGNPGNLARLSRLIDKGLPLPFSSIQARRSYLYVSNLVTAIEACLLNERAFGEDFIVCDDTAVSLPELVREIARAKGRSVRLVPCHQSLLAAAGVVGDWILRTTGKSVGIDSYSVKRLVSPLVCDNQKIKRIVGWSPAIAFGEALSSTFKYEDS